MSSLSTSNASTSTIRPSQRPTPQLPYLGHPTPGYTNPATARAIHAADTDGLNYLVRHCIDDTGTFQRTGCAGSHARIVAHYEQVTARHRERRRIEHEVDLEMDGENDRRLQEARLARLAELCVDGEGAVRPGTCDRVREYLAGRGEREERAREEERAWGVEREAERERMDMMERERRRRMHVMGDLFRERKHAQERERTVLQAKVRAHAIVCPQDHAMLERMGQGYGRVYGPPGFERNY